MENTDLYSRTCSPIKMFFKHLQRFTIIQLFFVITFFVSGIVLNTIQGIMYYTLRYYNCHLYRKINYYLLHTFYSQLVYLLQWWSDSKILIYLEEEEIKKYLGEEHSLVVINHSYEIDWLVMWRYCEGVGILGGFKAFLKKSIQFMPPIGLTCKFAEYILLDRSFEKDKINIKKQINELGDYVDPMLLLLYAEGTRLSPEKLKASQEFAKERNLPILKHHLLPRTKGFITSLEGMREKIKVVYNFQLAFDKSAEAPPTIKTLLSGRPVTAHIYINRIPIEHIPKAEEDTAKWLYNLYEKKDKLQDIFHKTGSFYTQPEMKLIKPYTLKKTILPAINTLIWNIIVLVPMLQFLFGSLYNGDFFNFSIAFGILTIFYLLMMHAIGMSEISKSSAYGSTANKKKE